MAVLTTAYEDNRQDGDIIYYSILAASTVYKGAIVVTQNANGWLVPATDSAAVNMAGIAVENSVAVAGESNGDRGVRVFLNGVFQLPCTGASQAWVGRQVYALDDNTVALRQSTTNGMLVGNCVGYISATKVKVAVCCPCQMGWVEESWSSSSSSSSSFSSSSSSSSSKSSSSSSESS